MRFSPLRATIVPRLIFALTAVTFGMEASPRQLSGKAPAAPSRQPPFRAGTNFVHVDVYPTEDGAIVPGLTASDFDVLEDGVLQRIETFERVDAGGFAQQETIADPAGTREAASRAETSRGRLFVIFLDTYFVNVVGSHDIRQPLVNFLNRLLGPDDIFAIMTPDMSAADLSFAKRTDTVEGNLRQFLFWGQRDRMFPDDPVEQTYLECYSDNPQPRPGDILANQPHQLHIAKEMILRRREKKVIDALSDLSIHLRGVREGRKAVVVITGGWALFRENRELTDGQTQPPVPRVGIDPTGHVTPDLSATNLGYSESSCERDRQSLAMIDDRQAFYDLDNLANRSNVTFYPVDPMGLEASGKPMDDPELVKGESDAIAPRGGSIGLAAAKSENLRSLAYSTDGLAANDSNSLDAVLKRVAADLSSYYLLGYASTNVKLDGKFREITVRVRRSGVDVRARHGYRAPTSKEVEEASMNATVTVPSASSDIQMALKELVPARPGVPLRTSVSVARIAGHLRGWLVAEVDPSLFQQSDWSGGATASITVLAGNEQPLANRQGVIASERPAIVVDLGELPSDGSTLRAKVTPRTGGLPYTDTIHVGGAHLPEALLWRRGPSTGLHYMPTAVSQFSRTERLRMDVAVDASTALVAELLDRTGTPIPLPVQTSVHVDGSITWATAEVSLAPLAAGEYLLRLKTGSRSTVTAFRLVP